MRRLRTSLTYLLLVCLNHSKVNAWPYQAVPYGQFGGFHIRGGDEPEVQMESVDDHRSTDKTTARLQFQGEFRHHQLVPFQVSQLLPNQLHDFFKHQHHRNLLLKGGHNPTEEIPRTHELLEEWTQRSTTVSSTPPMWRRSDPNHHHQEYEQNHSVVAVHSTVPIVPGLSIKAVSYMGCRLLPNPDNHHFPMYEFTLIQDRYHAHGTKALVWLYRKVTGEAAPSSSSSSSSSHKEQPLMAAGTSPTGSRTTHGLCRISLEPDKEALRLSIYSMVRVSCSLPMSLLRVLPLSKQRIESKISASMAKQLKSEVLESADKIHSALQAWMAEQTAPNT